MNTPKIGVNLLVDLSLKYLLMYHNKDLDIFKEHEPQYFLNPLQQRTQVEFAILGILSKTNYQYFGNSNELQDKEQELIAKIIQDGLPKDYMDGFQNHWADMGSKYRYNNYGCFTHSQVLLSSNNQINANWINNPLKENEIKQHILTQGPKENTQCDFYEMILQNDIGGIVAISETFDIENFNYRKHAMGRAKVSQYWPKSQGDDNEYNIPKDLQKHKDFLTIPEYEQSQINECSHQYTIIRSYKPNKNKKDLYFKTQLTITQTHLSNNQVNKKVVDHYHLDAWQDHTDLPADQLKSYILLVKELVNSNKSYVLHCSAGIGRSGTLLTSIFLYKYIRDYLTKLKQYQDQNDNQMQKPMLQLSLFEVVRNMRMQRSGAIQSGVQYEFLYSVIRTMLSDINTFFEIDVSLD